MGYTFWERKEVFTVLSCLCGKPLLAPCSFTTGFHISLEAPQPPPAPPRRLGLLSGSLTILRLTGGSDSEPASPVITAPLSTGASSLENFMAWSMAGWGQVRAISTEASANVSLSSCALATSTEQERAELRAWREDPPSLSKLVQAQRPEAQERTGWRSRAHYLLITPESDIPTSFCHRWMRARWGEGGSRKITVRTQSQRSYRGSGKACDSAVLGGGWVLLALGAIWAQTLRKSAWLLPCGRGRIWEDCGVEAPSHLEIMYPLNKRIIYFTMARKLLDSGKVFFVEDKNCQHVRNLQLEIKIR